MSSFFKTIQNIIDPKRELSEEDIVTLVEERFTSTNGKSIPCCSCCELAGYPIDTKLCPECGRHIE